MSAPLRIFIGHDPRQEEAAQVLAHSIRCRSSIPVQIRMTDPIGRQGVTQFTYSRFMVPHWCGYQGAAVFMDSDMLCLGDMADLPGPAPHPLRVVKHGGVPSDLSIRLRSWTSLMVMDCARLRLWTPELVATAPDDRLMRLMDFTEDDLGELSPDWNRLIRPGHEPPPGTRIAHWSCLADPDAGPLIHRSGSAVWAAARADWLATRDAA